MSNKSGPNNGMYKHGMRRTRQYTIYCNMKKRCDNPHSPDYPRYGGRGIKYCNKWATFEGFWDDMKEGYTDDLTLDRKDNNQGYSKDNCQWASRKVQDNNRRTTHRLIYNGKPVTISDLSEMTGIKHDTLLSRYYRGLSSTQMAKPVSKELITFNGVTKTVAEYAKEYGMKYIQLKHRLMDGWSIEKALTKPLKKIRKHVA
jgi:hypothetical protein